MSANYEIPGAPGFSIPGGADMSPEERDAYLLRLRFGPSLFKSGQNFSSAGGDDNTTPGPTNAPQPGVMNPAVMRGFLQSANTPVAPSKTHSAQMYQQILDASSPGEQAPADTTPAQAQPRNEKEWNAQHPWISSIGPSQTDLQDYEMFNKSLGGQRQYEEQQGKQRVAEQNAANGDTRSNSFVKSAKIRAIAEAAQRGIALSFDEEGNPSYQPLDAKALEAAMKLKAAGGRGGGGGSSDIDAALAGQVPGQAPPAPSNPDGTRPYGGMPPPPGQRDIPGRQVAPGEKVLRPGDYTLNRDGSRNIWDGRQWNYQIK